MAGKIRGITIELEGDTSGLNKSLQDTNKEIKNTQNQLKDVDKLLKLDPKNVELLRQKQELLGKAIGESEDKLSDLKKAEENMKTKGVDKNSDAFMALQREIAETETNLKNLKKQADTTTKGMQKIADVAKKVGDGAKTVADKTRGLSAAAGGLVASLGAMGLSSIKTADDLATLSARTGISTDMLQKFQFASDMVDVSTEELATAFKKMKINMDQNPEAFEALGVAVTDVDGKFRPLEDVFYDVIGSLSQIDDETQRDITSMDIFGKGADTLATIIDDGGATLQEYSQKAEDLGVILDEDTIAKLTETGDQIDTLKATATATMTELGSKILTEMGPTLEDILSKIQDLITWIGTLDGDTLQTIITIGLVVAAISPLAGMIANVSGAITGVTKTIDILKTKDIPWGSILGIGAIIAAVTLIATKGDEIKEIFNKVDTWIKNVFSKDWTEQFGIFGNVINALSENIKNIWDGIKETFSGVIDFIQSVFKGDWDGAWNGIKEIFKGVWDTFEGIMKAPINGMIGLINGLIDGINWIIRGINSISVEIPDWVPFVGGERIGFNLGEIGKIAYLAKGGILQSGSAIVGEAGPELLTMGGQGAVVQPLTNNTTNSYGGVNINVYGAPGQSVQQLAEIVMEEIGNATRRQEAVFG